MCSLPFWLWNRFRTCWAESVAICLVRCEEAELYQRSRRVSRFLAFASFASFLSFALFASDTKSTSFNQPRPHLLILLFVTVFRLQTCRVSSSPKGLSPQDFSWKQFQIGIAITHMAPSAETGNGVDCSAAPTSSLAIPQHIISTFWTSDGKIWHCPVAPSSCAMRCATEDEASAKIEKFHSLLLRYRYE